MSRGQWRGAFLLLGIASLLYGIFAVYNSPEFTLVRLFGGLAAAISEGPGFGEVAKIFGELYINAPYPYVGGVLLLIGLLIPRDRVATPRPATAPQPIDMYHNCRECGQPVRSSMDFCPHCGATAPT